MLIWISVLLLIAGYALEAVLPGGGTGDVNTKSMNTVTKLEKVEQAMTGFMEKNGRRPCPADGQYDVNTKYFGIEAANSGTCTGGTPVADFVGTSSSPPAIPPAAPPSSPASVRPAGCRRAWAFREPASRRTTILPASPARRR